MAESASNIVVAQRGTVYIADVGTEVDDDPATPLGVGFTELGYTTEDGVTFSVSADVTDINAWQSPTPVRRITTSRSAAISLTLEEWTEQNFALAFGGGAWSSPTAGVYQYDPPADTDAVAEYCLVVDFHDGDQNSRIEVYRGNVDGSVETQLTRTGAAVLPITFTALTPDDTDRAWRYLSDDASFVAS